MDSTPRTENLQRMLYREFLLEPNLYQDAGLESLLPRLSTLLACPEEQALDTLLADPLLRGVSLPELQSLVLIRDMNLFSKTAATVSSELKQPHVSYDQCCRTALCYAVIGNSGHAFGALRAAASKNDTWARHHYLYGIVLALDGNEERARWELGMALQYEPYEQGRSRIRQVFDIIDGKVRGSGEV